MREAPLTLPTRVGLIGDVHTESRLLHAGLEWLLERGAEALLCVGDIADGPEEVGGMEACRGLLQKYEVHTIAGNHDRWLLEGNMRELRDAIDSYELEPDTVEFVRSLPPVLRFETGLGPLLLCHGVGADDMAMLRPHDGAPSLQNNKPLQELLGERRYRLVVNGHTHQRMVRNIDGTVFINAGTLHRRNDPCVALLDFTEQCVTYYGFEGAEDEPLTLERIPLPLE